MKLKKKSANSRRRSCRRNKRNEKLALEKDQLVQEYEDQLRQVEDRLNSQATEFTSQYNHLESEKRKIELKLNSMEIENQKNHEGKIGDNKAAHYQTMKKDMQKLIEFKNELESLVEQQNNELLKKNDEFKMFQKELSSKNNQIEHMNEYIKELEKQVKSEENRIHKTEVKMRQLKQGQIIEMSKKMRDQENQIEILKGMIEGSKKELKSKVHNINTLKKRVGSLEKITKIHLSRHSDIQSMNSRDYVDQTQANKMQMFSSIEDEDKVYYSYDKPNPINEAREDLEETGKFKNETKTAHFAKSFEPTKKKSNLVNASQPNLANIASNTYKTPKVKLLKDISPQKLKSK